MWQTDWLVCASVSEGYSLVVEEALLLGIPVITTACVGPEERKHGMVVENSEQGLQEGLRQILKDDQLWTAWKQAVRTQRDRMYEIR